MKNFIVVFALFFISCQNGPDLSDQIQIRLPKGYKSTLQLESKLIYAQRIMDEYQTQVITYKYDMDMEVMEVKNNGYVFKIKYKKIENGLEDATDTLFFSTDDSSAPPYFKALLDSDFYLHMNANGVVTNFSGAEDFNEKLLSLYEGITVNEAQIMLEQMNRLVGKEQSMGNFQTLFALYPKGNIEEGNQWKSEVAFINFLPVKFSNTYKLVFENQDSFGIEGNSEFETDGKAVFEVEKTKMRFNLKGNIYSEATLNKNDGWLKKYEEEKWVEGDLQTYLEEQKVYVSVPVRMKLNTHLNVK